MRCVEFILLSLPIIAVAEEIGGNAYPFDSTCLVDNVKRTSDNQIVPGTLNLMRSAYKDSYAEMPPEKSILHNFRDGLESLLSTPEGRITASIIALYEYHNLPMEQWEFLDPALPNVKFVEIGGKKEVVYNKETGEKVDRGPNQGTANDAPQDSPNHISDIIWYELCGTPDDVEHALGELISKIKNEGVKNKLLEEMYDKAINGATRKEVIEKIIKDAAKAIESERKEEIRRNRDKRRASRENHSRVRYERRKSRAFNRPTNNKERQNDDELSPDQIPDPDNDNYVWCEDVCGEEGMRPVCPDDTANCIYWGCSRCGHVIRRKAKIAKRKEREWKAKGIEGVWHGSQLDVRQAKSADE